MNRLKLLAGLVTLIAAILWLILSPGLESVIAASGALLALLGLWRVGQDDAVDRGAQVPPPYLAIDPSATKSDAGLKRIQYDPAIKIWELLEMTEELVPEARPADYDKTWCLRDLGSSRRLSGLGRFYRERGFLEEEQRCLTHAAITPNSTLQVVLLN